METPREVPLYSKAARGGAHILIRSYQLTLSSIMGRHCRYLPTCSEYTDEAIQRHGLWAGGWMGFARICRCRPARPPAMIRCPSAIRADAPMRPGGTRTGKARALARRLRRTSGEILHKSANICNS